MQSSTTTDPRYQLESDKLTVIHLKREPRKRLTIKRVLNLVFSPMSFIGRLYKKKFFCPSNNSVVNNYNV